MANGNEHPLYEIRDLIYGNECTGVPKTNLELVEAIRDLCDAEFEFWGSDLDTNALYGIGFAAHRTQYLAIGSQVNRERVFLDHWIKENAPSLGVNSGEGLLQHLLSENPPRWPTMLKHNNEEEYWGIVTKRDWIVATEVVRWLGSNVGQSFLQVVQADIKNRQALLDDADLGKKPRTTMQAADLGI